MRGCLMDSSSGAKSKFQLWMRDYSSLLKISYDASSKIEHRVTKGESREHQIIDVFHGLLPNSISTETNVTVIDRNNNETPKFDGVLLDRSIYPLLFQQDSTKIAMIESICAFIEVKSNLEKDDVEDIIAKCTKIKEFKDRYNSPSHDFPIVTVFVFNCQNVNIRFFDLALHNCKKSIVMPNPICIINKGVFSLIEIKSNTIFPTVNTDSGKKLGFFKTDIDSLLLYFYLICRRAISWTNKYKYNLQPVLDTIMAYSKPFFQNQNAFYFDDDFLKLLHNDPDKAKEVRELFKGKGDCDISDIYKKAKTLQ